jgi:hypothetical protein
LTPKLAALAAPVEPVREILPLPLVVEIVEAPPVTLIPWEAASPAPPVPMSVMLPPPLVLILPPVSEMPWQAPAVPVELAVTAIVLPDPLVAKLALEAKPMLPLPEPPIIEFVATMLPAVEKFAARLIPWLVAPDPPVQVEKVTVPEVPVVIADVMETPCEFAPLELDVPLIVIGPLVLVIAPPDIDTPV